MAEPLRPGTTLTRGKRNWIFVTTIADQDAPTALEINAGTSLDITNILFASTTQPDQSTESVQSERRWGDTVVYSRIGDTTYSGGDMVYQFNPQGAAASDGVKLWETIPDGTTGFLVRRLGVARATSPAAGQFVDVFPVEFGPSIPIEQGDGATQEAAAKVRFEVTGPPSYKAAIA